MEAPTKLYVNTNDHLTRNGFYSFTENNRKDSVEYTCTDAFIEKAAEWLFNQANYYTRLKIDAHNGGVYADFYTDKMVEDFKKAMILWKY